MNTKICNHCGEKYTVYPCNFEKSKFCSRKCMYASKKGKDIEHLKEIRKKGVCLNTGRTHFKKGISGSPNTEFRKGVVPWNAGKQNIYTEEYLRKLSDSHKGQRVSPETEFTEGHAPWNKGVSVRLSPATEFKKGDIRITGENNPMWKGGVSSVNDKIRKGPQYKTWRREVYKRDKWACQKCGTKTRNIVAHHIYTFADYPDLRFDINNGVTLCRGCHTREHSQIQHNNK